MEVEVTVEKTPHRLMPVKCPMGFERPCFGINSGNVKIYCPLYSLHHYKDARFDYSLVVSCLSDTCEIVNVTTDKKARGTRIVPEKCPAGRRVCSNDRNGYFCPYNKSYWFRVSWGRIEQLACSFKSKAGG